MDNLDKTIKNDEEYQITQAHLKNFERELAAIETQNPSLHPRLTIGRINSFKRTIDRLKEELAEYEKLALNKTVSIDVDVFDKT